MSYREVSVIEIVEILRLWLQGLGLREVARLSGLIAKPVAGTSTVHGPAGSTATAVSVSCPMS
ncbi:helix-turn-helix domain-containing protein [Mycolicibacterium sp. XJ662]